MRLIHSFTKEVHTFVAKVFFNVLLASARRFDILKVRGGGRDESTASISGVTREFSPVAGDCSHLRGSSSRSWMDLSFDMKSVSLAPAAAQVRKSRRGPRSRSSQYGGVILYRGTGGFDTAHAAASFGFLFSPEAEATTYHCSTLFHVP
ncbi:hypothetical protein Bca52824_038796 [Brassica carinata]|uniref:Uncharacterized protein n=1 Tax=Brassica carinata TaxID=52824 RepID=A0A8X7UV90_BRACI|nr:hypothetical protein Bca52824_038796 [Brassica carinata]